MSEKKKKSSYIKHVYIIYKHRYMQIIYLMVYLANNILTRCK